jgi:hypothetical protein
MLFKSLKIFLTIFFVILFSFFSESSVKAFFSYRQILGGNKVSLGDWEAPQLSFVELPNESKASLYLRFKLKSWDNQSSIGGIEFTLYSGEKGSTDSDWVKTFRSTDCDSGTCSKKEEFFSLDLDLDFIDNPNHRLCLVDTAWCTGKPLPLGNYYLEIKTFDQSSTVNLLGNMSDPLFFSVEKTAPKVVCLSSGFYLRVAAGEPVSFPSVSCEGEAPLVEIRWDLDAQNGVSWEHPDFYGEMPIWQEGYLVPGSYQASVWGKNNAGEIEIKIFEVDVSNPLLAYQSLLINEFLPNPVGDDNAPLPLGEWVEIFNPGRSAVDLLGFVIYDAYNAHELPISAANIEGGETIIYPQGYKVIYRAGSPIFSLNNQGPEKVRLFAGFIENSAPLLDQVSYDSSFLEEISYSRFPDGAINFLMTSSPTKGTANQQ